MTLMALGLFGAAQAQFTKPADAPPAKEKQAKVASIKTAKTAPVPTKSFTSAAPSKKSVAAQKGTKPTTAKGPVGTPPVKGVVAPSKATPTAPAQVAQPEFSPETSKRIYDLELQMKLDPSRADELRPEFEQLMKQRNTSSTKK